MVTQWKIYIILLDCSHKTLISSSIMDQQLMFLMVMCEECCSRAEPPYQLDRLVFTLYLVSPPLSDKQHALTDTPNPSRSTVLRVFCQFSGSHFPVTNCWNQPVAKMISYKVRNINSQTWRLSISTSFIALKGNFLCNLVKSDLLNSLPITD